LNVTRPATQDHDFKARIVIEMGMERRDDNFVMLMLKVGQFFREKASVMVNGPCRSRGRLAREMRLLNSHVAGPPTPLFPIHNTAFHYKRDFL
jgi:hypothetical protein